MGNEDCSQCNTVNRSANEIYFDQFENYSQSSRSRSVLSRSNYSHEASLKTTPLAGRVYNRQIIKLQSFVRMLLVRRRLRPYCLQRYRQKVQQKLASIWTRAARGVQYKKLGERYEQGMQFCQGMVFQEGIKYAGQVKGGKRHGRGICITPENQIFYSVWENNLNKGPGVFISASNEVYEGIFLRGRLEGRGSWLFPGGQYEGSFKGGVPEGQGKLIHLECQYRGMFKCGMKEGQGLLVSKSFKYKGQFQRDRFQGFGQLLAKGSNYRGLFSEGLYHGLGHYSTQNQEFIGYFANGLRQGFGILLLDNGQSVKGYYKNDKLNGVVQLLSQNESRKCVYQGGVRKRWLTFGLEQEQRQKEEQRLLDQFDQLSQRFQHIKL